jgi:hypothetical protein
MVMDPNKPRDIPTTRSPMGFGEKRKFNSIQLGITLYCDRMCPDCCCSIPKVENRQHVSVEWIKKISKHFQGLRALQISGGEPTLHPQFKYITENIRDWFNPEILMLMTNGSKIVEYADILGYYDQIRITHYNKDTYPKCKDNIRTYKKFIEVFEGPSYVNFQPVIHKTEGGTAGLPCLLGANDTAMIQWNKIFPCCVAPGQNPDLGIEITENWREELKKIPLPCKGCPFSPEKKLSLPKEKTTKNKKFRKRRT